MRQRHRQHQDTPFSASPLPYPQMEERVTVADCYRKLVKIEVLLEWLIKHEIRDDARNNELLHALGENQVGIKEAVDQLETDVGEIETVTESTLVFIAGIKAQLDEAIASGQMERVQELSVRLDAKKDALAAAIAANTDAGGETGGGETGGGTDESGNPV